jgi:glyoxylase-like metal-dependent hydrolase (beta-lactamase superfamily II)
MAANMVVPGLWEVSLGFVNAFLLEMEGGLVLIDTGVPGSAQKIMEAVRALGRAPGDVRQILVTHCHSDHSGSVAELKRLTSAPATMHADDAAMVRAGNAMRPVKPAPGLVNGIVGRMIRRLTPKRIGPAEIEHEAQDGEVLPIAGGLQAVHAPGHCAGQLVFLWPQHGGVLIAADAAANVLRLGFAPVYEDLEEGKQSLAKLAALEFEVACFGHGRPIRSGASKQFRETWAQAREVTRQVP